MQGQAFLRKQESSEQTVTGGDTSSIETITAVPEAAGRWSLWGRGALTHFAGVDESVNLEGDVLTGLLGLDYARNRWLAGVALSYSDGDGSYRAAGNDAAGDLDSTLVSVYPYLRYALTARLSVWGALGYGAGTLRLHPGRDQDAIETDMQMSMGALGLRGVVYATQSTELALKSDALWVRTTSDAAPGLQAVDGADASRVRLLLAGRHQRALVRGAMLTPSFELGVRYDEGDAETGLGVELGGGLRYADPLRGLTVEATARTLLAHEDGGYEEWGVGGTLQFDPGVPGRGPAFSLASAWGVSRRRRAGVVAAAGYGGTGAAAIHGPGGAYQGRVELRTGRPVDLWDTDAVQQHGTGRQWPYHAPGLAFQPGPQLEPEPGRRTPRDEP